jgi:hypothetical protein
VGAEGENDTDKVASQPYSQQEHSGQDHAHVLQSDGSR